MAFVTVKSNSRNTSGGPIYLLKFGFMVKDIKRSDM